MIRIFNFEGMIHINYRNVSLLDGRFPILTGFFLCDDLFTLTLPLYGELKYSISLVGMSQIVLGDE
jgi:hypothetical protein